VTRVVLTVLPGEPTDGTGRVRIHHFVRDGAGPVRLPARVEPTPAGPLRLGGGVGKIACRPALADVDRVAGGVARPVLFSDDPRAVTCPECRATEDYQKAQARLGEAQAAQGGGR
jgi:hypothetical protein